MCHDTPFGQHWCILYFKFSGNEQSFDKCSHFQMKIKQSKNFCHDRRLLQPFTRWKLKNNKQNSEKCQIIKLIVGRIYNNIYINQPWTFSHFCFLYFVKENASHTSSKRKKKFRNILHSTLWSIFVIFSFFFICSFGFDTQKNVKT